MRIITAGLIGLLSAAPAVADQVTAIRRPDGSVAIVQTRGSNSQVINSTGKPSYRVNDLPHESVVRSVAPYGSQIANPAR